MAEAETIKKRGLLNKKDNRSEPVDGIVNSAVLRKNSTGCVQWKGKSSSHEGLDFCDIKDEEYFSARWCSHLRNGYSDRGINGK